MTWISKYFPRDEIRNVYTLAARVKSKNKVREMQYKILNKYLATNVLLNRKYCKICSFCAEEREDLKHLFFGCYVIKEFWMAFNKWWTFFTEEKISLCYSDIIFNTKF